MQAKQKLWVYLIEKKYSKKWNNSQKALPNKIKIISSLLLFCNSFCYSMQYHWFFYFISDSHWYFFQSISVFKIFQFLS